MSQEKMIINREHRTANGEKTMDLTTIVSTSDTIKPSEEKKTRYADGYHYYIYDIEYHAGRREQANLMYDTFQALSEKYPEKAADMAAVCTSVAKKSDVLAAGTHDSNPSYFRICREYTILGIEYLVGASYGLDAKIAEIYRMIDCCDEDRTIFRLDRYEKKRETSHVSDKKEKCEKSEEETSAEKKEKTSADKFVYELWGERHTADKLSNLMHDVFDFIADKYAEKIPDIAKDDSVTFVAYKKAVDQKEIPMSRLSYFRAKKEHDVNGEAYYVSTSYNRQQGIGQLNRMLEKCEGYSDSLKIISYPQKAVYGGRKRKAGLEELL